jgi:hypothetical protein
MTVRDPNRLTLVLGESGKVIIAVWIRREFSESFTARGSGGWLRSH